MLKPRWLLAFVGFCTLSISHSLQDEAPTDSPFDPFSWEKIELTEDKIRQGGLEQYLKCSDGSQSEILANQKCKTFPGDSNWPSEDAWKELGTALGGALIKAAPAASVCFNQTVFNNYDESKCKTVSGNWSRDYVRMKDPVEVVSPMFEGLTCLPPSDFDTKGCTSGGYPVYVVNATTVAHVQAAVNFARNAGIRLVIKNTGHDLSGKSLGGGAISVWTHYLKDIQFYADGDFEGYTGPAFKVGAGVQASEILKAARDKKHIAATGVCDSVGIYGGYTQGGGHSPLSALHGMGADQVLQLRVVTADGKFLTASPSKNTDLFWAIRGGGGSTFGIVTSMVVKAYPDQHTSVASFEWSSQDQKISADTFWEGLQSYFSYFENFTNEGLFSDWNLFPDYTFVPGPAPRGPRMDIRPFLGIGKTLDELKAATKPWLDEMAALGINTTVTWDEFPTFYQAFYRHLTHTETSLMPYSMAYASRLIPRENMDKSKKLNATAAVFRKMSEAGHVFNGFQLSPTLEKGKPVGGGNAVLPAWRDALSHTIAFLKWPDNTTAAEQLRLRRGFATEGMREMRELTPNSGSYLSESDRLEPEWQKSFYGENYPRLLEIKKKYDPEDVFYAVTAVGSESWAVRSVDGLPTENGPLCRV